MNIFNIMKKASIALGLLLIPTVITTNCQYADATKAEKSSKTPSKNTSREEESSKAVSKAEQKVIQDMYTAFQKLISNGVEKNSAKKFYEKYFATNIHKSFGLKKPQKEEFNDALIDYFVNLLNQQTLQDQINGHTLSKTFSKIPKGKSSVIKCTLIHGNETTDMSVVLTKDKKIKELSFINNTIQLIGGAKNIVTNYCRDNEKKQYKKLNAEEKLNMCKKAWEANFNK